MGALTRKCKIRSFVVVTLQLQRFCQTTCVLFYNTECYKDGFLFFFSKYVTFCLIFLLFVTVFK